MKQIKSLSMSFIVVLTTLFLSGCSDALLSPQQVAMQQQQQQLANRCDKADYVLSDLTKPIGKREYLLKPGVKCDD